MSIFAEQDPMQAIVDAEWKAVIAERLAQVESGTAKLLDADSSASRIRERLARSRSQTTADVVPFDCKE